MVDRGARLAGRLPAGARPPPRVRSRRVLPARRAAFPPADDYGEFPMHEDGIGMARLFEAEVLARSPLAATTTPTAVGSSAPPTARCRRRRQPRARRPRRACGAVGVRLRRRGRRRARHGDVSGSTDAEYEPYRAVRATGDQLLHIGPPSHGTGRRAHRVLRRPAARAPARAGRPPRRAGAPGREPVLRRQRRRRRPHGRGGPGPGPRRPAPGPPLPAARRLPHPGRFLDGTAPEDLPRPVEIVPTDGAALRRALGLAGAAESPPPLVAALAAPEGGG